MAKCDKPNTCPKCGSSKIRYRGTDLCDDSPGYELYDDRLGFEFTCDSCGCKSIELYDLVFAYSVSSDDGF